MSAQPFDEEMESYGEKDEEEGRESDGDEEVIKSTSGAQEMTVPSFFLKNGQLMTFCRRCRKRFSKIYVPVSNSSSWKV